MRRPRSIRTWAVVGLTSLVSLIAIEAAVHGEHNRGAARKGVSGVPAVSAVQLPVRPGAPNTPRAVLYRFASAYGEVSRVTATQREKLLQSLTAPPLRAQLRAAGPHSDLTADSDILRGASIGSLLVSLRLSPPSAGAVQGAVVLKQWLVSPGDSDIPQLQSSYAARLIRVGGAWRVSEFKLVP
jgi:hypothetical protein